MHKMLKNTITALVVVTVTIFLIVAVQEKRKHHKQEPLEIVDDPEAIISLEGLHVEPLESSRMPVPSFASYENIIDKKRAFFAYLLPEVRRQNLIVEKERDMIFSLQKVYSANKELSHHELEVLTMLKKKYKLDKMDEQPLEPVFEKLLVRVDVIPEQLILVQAANESGWGTSRFAVEGYNFFGLWCFKAGCGFVPKQRNDDAEHEVAKFSDLSHAVMTYIRNLNRLYAYRGLRQIRLELRKANQPVTAKALTNGLMSYSERGQEYIDELQSMLRVNKKYMDTAL